MAENKFNKSSMDVEQVQLFNNKETQYILKQQRMPAGTVVWHTNEAYKKEDMNLEEFLFKLLSELDHQRAIKAWEDFFEYVSMMREKRIGNITDEEIIALGLDIAEHIYFN